MGDQGVVDDVETHVHHINRAPWGRRPRGGQGPGRGTTRSRASNRPVGGRWEGQTLGGETVPDRDFHDMPSPGAERGAKRGAEPSAVPQGEREREAERRRRRAQFLRDLAEARQLRDRVQPRRAKTARLRHAMRMRTFRW
ncbi:hypothetical protein GCM10023177_57300 [Streptomyces violaceoruber]|nr:hypothetical protein JCM4020_41530 [Streptomyces coelicolor]